MKSFSLLGLGLALLAGSPRVASAGVPVLHYAQPAQKWTEALPVGNGRLGAMVFGDVDKEHLQFNEDSLWLGNETEMGSYQPFGDVYAEFAPAAATKYRRELNLLDAVHTVTFESGGAAYRREVFSSFPDQVLVMRLTAGRPGSVSGTVRIADAHKAATAASENRLSVDGSLTNGLKYAAEMLVLNEGGQRAATGGVVTVRNADAVTILLAAGTSFHGKDPRTGVTRQMAAASVKSFDALRAAHVADHRGLFDRVRLELGGPRFVGAGTDATERVPPGLRPTDERLGALKAGGADPGLEALLFQYGRYLLIASSRPGDLPANLQSGNTTHSAATGSSSERPPNRC